jgi:high-affinity iron transporter
MLATAVIVLREMLEICLIVGMLFAALKTLPNRLKLLSIGVISGIIISITLALSFYKISNLFGGDGQEILNITILSLSIFFLALTILWINKNAKNLNNKITKASIENEAFPIIVIITLAIAREGAELTLFLHGILASGTKIIELLIGSLLGFIIGTSLGFLIYVGLLKISIKYFFRIINIMLALLAAGLSSQLANYLNSIDIIEKFSSTMWNSSWLLSNESILGKILHGLIGYNSNPTQLQVIFYVSTLFLMLFLIKIGNKKSQNKS